MNFTGVLPAITTAFQPDFTVDHPAVARAKAAHSIGCSGLMILPPYVYKGDWRENKAHIAAVLAATPLPGMLYNNPVAYGTDFLPAQIAELANEYPNLAA